MGACTGSRLGVTDSEILQHYGSTALLERVNREINRLPYRADPPGADFWQPHDGRGGDCEDYAIAKLVRLVAAGWPPDRLALRLRLNRDGLPHAVLLAILPSGRGIELDNEHGTLQPPGRGADFYPAPFGWQAVERNRLTGSISIWRRRHDGRLL